MSKTGRPTDKTEENIRKIEEAAALDCSIEEMALYANVHRATIYRWLAEDKEFSDRIETLRATPFLKARRTIEKSLDNPQYAFEYMKRKKKNEFSERLEQTGADGKDLPTPIIKLETNAIQRNNSNEEDTEPNKED